MEKINEEPKQLKFAWISDVMRRPYPQSTPAVATPEEIAIWRAVVGTVTRLPAKFVTLAAEEPRLWELAAKAVMIWAAQRGKEGRYCANADWYTDFKPELCELVGCSREGHPRLGTDHAYDVAYETIYELLPDCRDCVWCL
jgi:hypothetical protein